MPKKTYKPEEIIGKLREAEVRLSQGASVFSSFRFVTSKPSSDGAITFPYNLRNLRRSHRVLDSQKHDLCARPDAHITGMAVGLAQRCKLLVALWRYADSSHKP